jgi:hypothetical protein
MYERPDRPPARQIPYVNPYPSLYPTPTEKKRNEGQESNISKPRFVKDLCGERVSRTSRYHHLHVLRVRHINRHSALSLRNDFSSVELDEHGAVGFELFDGNGKPEVVEEEELEFEVIELC